MSDARLMSPAGAAGYLGLGSRWAVYRLISSGELPAIRLLGKLRVDRVDLDELIQRKKAESASAPATTLLRAAAPAMVPARLRRLDHVVGRPRARRVTTPVTGSSLVVEVLESSTPEVAAKRASECLSDVLPALDSVQTQPHNGRLHASRTRPT